MKVAYLAFDKAGHRVSDTLEAGDIPEASEVLRRRGLYVTEISGGDLKAHPAASRTRRVGRESRRLKNLAMLTRHLHAVVSCGTPLVEALGAMERQAKKGAWRDALAEVRSRIEEGASLSAAMETRPDCFDSLCRSLIAAGEASGNLAAMLDRVATMTRKRLHTRNAVRGAMVYPALLLGVAAVVLVLLLVLVIPRFAELFASMDVPLPPTTEALILVSGALRSYWWLALVLVVGPAVALRMYLVRPAGRRALDTVALRLPQVGRAVRSFCTARMARVLGELLESHVSILNALDLTRESVGNCHYVALVDRARDAIVRGKPMSAAFGETDLVSPSVCEAVRNGEQNGQVGPLLLNIADFLDEENEVVVRSLTSIIEPVILVLMGVLVGVVAVSMFLPLFDLAAMAQGGG